MPLAIDNNQTGKDVRNYWKCLSTTW